MSNTDEWIPLSCKAQAGEDNVDSKEDDDDDDDNNENFDPLFHGIPDSNNVFKICMQESTAQAESEPCGAVDCSRRSRLTPTESRQVDNQLTFSRKCCGHVKQINFKFQTMSPAFNNSVPNTSSLIYLNALDSVTRLIARKPPMLMPNLSPRHLQGTASFEQSRNFVHHFGPRHTVFDTIDRQAMERVCKFTHHSLGPRHLLELLDLFHSLRGEIHPEDLSDNVQLNKPPSAIRLAAALDLPTSSDSRSIFPFARFDPTSPVSKEELKAIQNPDRPFYAFNPLEPSIQRRAVLELTLAHFHNVHLTPMAAYRRWRRGRWRCVCKSFQVWVGGVETHNFGVGIDFGHE